MAICREFSIRVVDRDSTFANFGNADFVFIQRFGIIPETLLKKPRLGVLNVHFSLLPEYRGIHPVPWALINDEKETGVTLHMVDGGIDTGPILKQEKISISDADDLDTLTRQCSELAKAMALDLLQYIDDNDRLPEAFPQVGKGSYARRRKPSDRFFDPSSVTPRQLFKLVKALRPPLQPACCDISEYGPVQILDCHLDANALITASGNQGNWSFLHLDKGTVLIHTDVNLPKEITILSNS